MVFLIFLETNFLFFFLLFFPFFFRLKNDFEQAMNGVMSLLARHSEPSKLLYVGELLRGQTFSPKMVCSFVFHESNTPFQIKLTAIFF